MSEDPPPGDPATAWSPQLMDGILTPVIITDRAGRLQYLNRACAATMGCSRTPPPGSDIDALFVDALFIDPVAVRKLLDRVGPGLAPARGELAWRLPDGREKTLEWTAVAVEQSVVDQRAVKDTFAIIFSGLLRGGREQLTRTVNDANIRGRAAMSASADCIIMVDDAGLIESFNPSAECLFGYPADELVGLSMGLFLDEDDPERRQAWVEAALHHPSLGHRGSDHEFTARRQDGMTFPCDLSLAPLELSGRRLYTVMLRNATERRRTEQEMARMRLDLKSIIDSMPSVLVGVDRDCAITAWNREAEKATGVPARDALGHSFREFFPELEQRLAEVREAVHDDRLVDTRRLTVEDEEGHRHLEVMVYPLLARGTQGAVIRVDDVTARVRIEQTMVQTEKMLSVGGLAAGMAHEINNPLGAITQSCQNVLRRLSADLPRNMEIAEGLGIDLKRVRAYLDAREVPEFLETIRAAAGRASHIVNDMLSFSRTGNGHRAPALLPELVETALRLAGSDYHLRKRYDFHEVVIERDFDPELPAVPCDATAIEQVLLNLFKNAAQAMAEAGTTAPTLRLGTSRLGVHACLTVEDNGPGMDAATQRRVFEPFFTTKEVGIGTGLGLSVSYFIVTEQHGGTLSVESTPGRGTRFTLTLPLEQTP